ncbi:MAG: delta-60 repeat domain-containing protein [Flavobacteriales bacterium]|nr:delta-60 repeat domain-containing protein [Flavobacteriales bacterium]
MNTSTPCEPCVATAQVPIIDYSFQAVPPTTLVNKVIVQPDGKILVGGGFDNYAGSGKNNLVRLNSDGTVDSTFNPGGSGPDFLVQDIDLMPDGRILIAGNFGTYNGIQNYFVARLFPNGTLDPGFHVPPNSINNAVYAVALHRNNTVLAAGEFFICAGLSQPRITRFDSTGVVDTTFLVGAGFTNTVYDLLVLPDDRIVAGGSFYNYQNNPSGNIALLAPNGLIDPLMDNDPGFQGPGRSGHWRGNRTARSCLGGYFSYHNSVPRAGIARLDLSGAYDPTFTSPLYPYARVDAIAVQADGHILVGGEFIRNMYDPRRTRPVLLGPDERRRQPGRHV